MLLYTIAVFRFGHTHAYSLNCNKIKYNKPQLFSWAYTLNKTLPQNTFSDVYWNEDQPCHAKFLCSF